MQNDVAFGLSLNEVFFIRLPQRILYGKNFTDEFCRSYAIDACRLRLGSSQAALVIQLFDDEIVSGIDVDIGKSREVSLLVKVLLCGFLFSTVLD